MLGVTGSLDGGLRGQRGAIQAPVCENGVGCGENDLGEFCGSHRSMLSGLDSGPAAVTSIRAGPRHPLTDRPDEAR